MSKNKSEMLQEKKILDAAGEACSLKIKSPEVMNLLHQPAVLETFKCYSANSLCTQTDSKQRINQRNILKLIIFYTFDCNHWLYEMNKLLLGYNCT